MTLRKDPVALFLRDRMKLLDVMRIVKQTASGYGAGCMFGTRASERCILS
jgi:hypothetical protein